MYSNYPKPLLIHRTYTNVHLMKQVGREQTIHFPIFPSKYFTSLLFYYTANQNTNWNIKVMVLTQKQETRISNANNSLI